MATRASLAFTAIAAGAAAVLVLWWHSTRGGYIQSLQSALDTGA